MKDPRLNPSLGGIIMTDEGWIEGAELSSRAIKTFGSASEFKEWLLVRLAKGRVAARAKSWTCNGFAPVT